MELALIDCSGDQAFYKQNKAFGSGRGGRGRGRARGRGGAGASGGLDGQQHGRDQDGHPPRKRSKSDLTCYVCDKRGHMARECPDRK